MLPNVPGNAGVAKDNEADGYDEASRDEVDVERNVLRCQGEKVKCAAGLQALANVLRPAKQRRRDHAECKDPNENNDRSDV